LIFPVGYQEFLALKDIPLLFLIFWDYKLVELHISELLILLVPQHHIHLVLVFEMVGLLVLEDAQKQVDCQIHERFHILQDLELVVRLMDLIVDEKCRMEDYVLRDVVVHKQHHLDYHYKETIWFESLAQWNSRSTRISSTTAVIVSRRTKRIMIV
jgi:hypothetical protein